MAFMTDAGAQQADQRPVAVDAGGGVFAYGKRSDGICMSSLAGHDGPVAAGSRAELPICRGGRPRGQPWREGRSPSQVAVHGSVSTHIGEIASVLTSGRNDIVACTAP